ncbi:MAG: hypothetical protein VW257_08925 [Quisquiliibacterium sp.]
MKSIFAERFDRGPLATVDDLVRFVDTRAAYVAQTSLYGYLKTRMGTDFQRHFEDEIFSGVIRASVVRVYAACLADLAVFTVATARAAGGMGNEECAALASHCYRAALAKGVSEPDQAHLPGDGCLSFDSRAHQLDWDHAAKGENAFLGSAASLIACAPVVPEFKKLDQEIVTNSIRFRWRDVREVGRRRIDGAAVAASWRERRQA